MRVRRVTDRGVSFAFRPSSALPPKLSTTPASRPSGSLLETESATPLDASLWTEHPSPRWRGAASGRPDQRETGCVADSSRIPGIAMAALMIGLVGTQGAEREEHRTADDGDICEVEGGPPAGVEIVGDLSVDGTIDHVGGSSGEDRRPTHRPHQ